MSRAAAIEHQAARLFAERGFGATTIDDIGTASGVSGPAIYWHFRNKQALLAAMLIDISERLLAGGQACVSEATDAQHALRRLVTAQVDFALTEPDLIVVHARELHHLDDAQRHRVRALQRRYVDVWVDAAGRRYPNAPRSTVSAAVQAVIGLINSTPYLGRIDRATLADLLARLAHGALDALDSGR
jgi:AcrR family transcriptional regulator